MTVAEVLPEFVCEMPDDLEEGIMYISAPFRTSVHLCACGCRGEVWMPIRPDRHHLTWDGDTVTITPSVGNWGLPCQSHYWIRSSQISWVPVLSHSGGDVVDEPGWLIRQLRRLRRLPTGRTSEHRQD